MSLEIFALRHAATHWNQQKRLQGRRDILLSDTGRESLRGKTIPLEYQQMDWYSSPLLRARQTAELLGIQNCRQQPALTEMDWGEWEGERLPELRAQLGRKMHAIEALGLDMQPPGGETPRLVRQRVLAWLQTLPTEGRIGIVCHKGVLRSLLSEALLWDMQSACPIRIEWDKGLLFCLEPGQNLRLLDYNQPLAACDN